VCTSALFDRWRYAMRDKYDIIVVGGGPAGSTAGRYAASNGAKVLLLEKDREIGVPVRCAEGVGDEGLSSLVEIQPRWISQKITGVYLYAPSGERVRAATGQFGFILNRKVFDYDLAEMAAQSGVEIRTKAYVCGILRENGAIRGVQVRHLGKQQTVHTDLVIGADGVESRVGRWAGLATHTRMHDMESCAQVTAANINVENDHCHFFFGRGLAPGGYVWIFPKGDGIANVGLGISGEYAKQKSAVEFLNEFLSQRFPKAAVLTMVAGGVPCAATLKKIVTDGLMLVGDAAHQANPISGGGIVSGMIAGKLAGQVAAQAIEDGNVSEKKLSPYVRLWNKAEGNNHRRMYRVKEAVNKMSDQDLNRTAEVLLQVPIEKRTVVGIFKAGLVKHPGLIFDVIKVFS